MNTRPADISDIAALIRLSRQAHEQHVEAIPGRYKAALDDTEAAEFFTRYLDSPDVHAWVAETDGELIGYLSAEFRFIRENPFRDAVRQFELDQVVVDNEHRGRGAGRELLEKFVAKAIELDADELLVHTLHFNRQAHEFFRHCGFTELSLNLWKPM